MLNNKNLTIDLSHCSVHITSIANAILNTILLVWREQEIFDDFILVKYFCLNLDHLDTCGNPLKPG